MVFFKALACVAAAAVALAPFASAAPIDISARSAPAGWSNGGWEPYNTYHTRYLQLGCSAKKNTQFFTTCCGPLKSNQLLSSRPAECTPGSTSSSTTPTTPIVNAVTSTDDETDECGDDTDDTTADATTSLDTTDNTGAQGSGSSSSRASSTSSHHTSTSTAHHAAASSSSSSGNTSSGSYQGMATYFYQEGQAGACGTVHSDNDLIAAIDKAWWPSEGATSSPYCGRSVLITNNENGKTVTVTVADVCPGCVSANSLDLSLGAFKQLAPMSEGTFAMTWKFS